MAGKPLVKSKLAGLGTLVSVTSLLAAFTEIGNQFVANNPELVMYLGAVVGLATVVLRMVTKEPINSVT